MSTLDVYFITHPNVAIDRAIPVPDWSLSARGRERMRAFAVTPLGRSFASVYSSAERKAVEGADILVEGTALVPRVFAELGENDRSATGYIPKAEFEALADRFFAEPDHSVRGWEKARDAQARIVRAVNQVLALADVRSPVAIVSHGGVGTLLLCHLLREPISRARDQPGSEGGNYFRFEAPSLALIHAWRPI